MTDIDKTERARQRGINARLLLETPLLVEALAEVRKELMAAWEASPAADEKGREKLWLMLKLLNKIPAHLETVMNDGKIAEHELVEVERRKKFRIFG